MYPVEMLWNCSHQQLKKMDGYIIVGGFSYEDRSRAGIIAALDPIMTVIKNESSNGKPVLGICNGAQILIESGLVPGLKDNAVAIALTDNKRIINEKVVGVGYYNSWSNLKVTTNPDRCAFTRVFKKDSMINIPFAHGEGRFVMPAELLKELQKNNQIAFKYANENGDEIDEFPTNPNGSQNNIAAICNASGNVMAIMPHPERTTNGDQIFSSMKRFIDEKCPLVDLSLKHTPTKIKPKQLTINGDSIEWIVNLVITDNEAKSVNKALNTQGYDVSVNRSIHWEINIQKESERVLNDIINSGELFNSNKEYIVKEKEIYDYSILVRQKDDVYGRAKYESLVKRFGLNEISYIKRGVIWNVNFKSSNLNNEIESILTSNIFYNPNSYEYYRINK